MKACIDDFDYPLPPELVAQYPVEPRDASRLLVLDRQTGEVHHAGFGDLPQWLDAGDLLVVNDTQVFPARLTGFKDTGGKVELLLHGLPQPEGNGGVPKKARALAGYRARRRLRPGQVITFGKGLSAEITALPQPGTMEVRFRCDAGDVGQKILASGEVPLPPYIRRKAEPSDQNRYQTIFARRPGAVACPTAGLHFTDEILEKLARQGIKTVNITLHVGPGTFTPVRLSNYTEHRLAPEYFSLSAEAAARLNEARRQGKRLLAVGTTTVRVLESCLTSQGFAAGEGWCDLFIYPGYRFKAVDRLITNFHLPRSTLLLLVSAFAGRELIMQAYEKAVKARYRFYSYGDCMLIL
ncbi:MAG: tRNA preQ1(34) S-adenosylmethionine ribosyltransferase-isomerase QueA [Deltaproteobacteria bacterium]|nr:tRNA preQ1(34) S-adenosylmethionine ribosyltransferase-isomerase QueA [Deltaproteobacteria bacterium]